MDQDEIAIRDVVKRVEAGWNAGSGEAFAAPFAEDADNTRTASIRRKGGKIVPIHSTIRRIGP